MIACSAGNHAQGVAYHATRLGIPSVIVMPEGTPFNKIQRTRDFGAEVKLHGKGFDDSVAFTLDLAARDGLTLIHPFDDLDVVAGQGTVAIEMLEQQPDLDTIVVPIGGGGLIAGMALAAKSLKPDVRIIGAQARLFDAVKARIRRLFAAFRRRQHCRGHFRQGALRGQSRDHPQSRRPDRKRDRGCDRGCGVRPAVE